MKTDPASLHAEFPIARTTREREADREGRLLTMCWCEHDMLLVPRQRVLAGATGSCGRHGCEAIAS